jgi:hypothetical protein
VSPTLSQQGECLTITLGLSPLMTDSYSLLYYSLQKAICHPNCASEAWLDKPAINSGPQYWYDDETGPLSLAFPARLNLEGAHSHTALNLRVENHELVRK